MIKRERKEWDKKEESKVMQGPVLQKIGDENQYEKKDNIFLVFFYNLKMFFDDLKQYMCIKNYLNIFSYKKYFKKYVSQYQIII